MTAAAAVAIYPIPPAPMPEAGSHQGSRVGSTGVFVGLAALGRGLPSNDEMKPPPNSDFTPHRTLTLSWECLHGIGSNTLPLTLVKRQPCAQLNSSRK